jgi:cell wall-associated NlpC family hydrolase
MAYTNSGLVKHCKEALKLKTVYMWGGLFREVTKDYINLLSGIKGYQSQYPAARKAHLNGLIGKGYYGCDCVGLVKSYYFGGFGLKANAPGYSKHKNWDYNVGTMYNAAKFKGKISSMPKKEGVLVMTSDFGHVGVYVGNGEVVECTLSKFGDGVVKTKFTDRSWAYWCQCPVIVDDTGVTKSNTGTNASYVSGKTNAPVNVRETAGISGKIITKLPKGTAVKMTGKSVKNGGYTWAEVLYNGKACWCDKQWIDS